MDLTDPEAMGRLHVVESTIREMVGRKYGGWPAEQDREDLVSIVLAKYFKRWGRGPGPDDPGPDPLRSWLTPVIRNAGIDVHRARPDEVLADEREPDDQDVEGWDLEQALAATGSPSLVSAQRDVWSRAFALLGGYERDLLVDKYVDQLPAAAIAAKIDKSVDATHKATQRALKHLQQALQEVPELQAELWRLHPRPYTAKRPIRKH